MIVEFLLTYFASLKRLDKHLKDERVSKTFNRFDRIANNQKRSQQPLERNAVD